jgi:hypothetical protein
MSRATQPSRAKTRGVKVKRVYGYYKRPDSMTDWGLRGFHVDFHGKSPITAARTLKRLVEIAAMGMTPENMADAIEWALGMGKDGFAPRQEGQGAYWWRTELRQRALGLASPAASRLSPKNKKKAGRKSK